MIFYKTGCSLSDYISECVVVLDSFLNHLRQTNRRKLLMRVNLTAFILVTTFLQVSLGARAQLVTLNGKNVSLEKAFKEIRKQTGYDFFYDSDLIQAAKPISINVNKADLNDALNHC